MNLTLEILFGFSVGLIVYVYAGYPLLLYIFTVEQQNTTHVGEQRAPRVTLLISAYNEKRVIREKIENAFAVEYPAENLEIIVVSDASDDGTDEIAMSFAGRGVRLVRQAERLGKSAGLNLGVAQSTGELLVFSDANSMYDRYAIQNLVRHFSDPRVGYAVGNCAYADSPAQVASATSEGLYWKLETWLKTKESDFGSVVGGDGAIYAIRRELFTPLTATDINDFLNPLQIIIRGYRGVYDPCAICYEEAGDQFEKEFRRKVRIISRSLNALRRAPRVLLPWNQFRHWLALISHKVLRWFVPIYLIVAAVSSFCLWQMPIYRSLFFAQACFYGLAGMGWATQSRTSQLKVFYLPYYFCLVNTASLIGIFKFFRGSLSPTWQTIRQELPKQQLSQPQSAKGGS